MKKIISMILILGILIGMFPTSASAAGSSYIEVTRDNAPIRKAASEKADVVVRCKEGTVLSSTGSCRNWYLNKWYKVSLDGQTYYIYSGNVKIHEHNPTNLNINGICYSVCKCGDVSVNANSEEQKAESQTVLGATSMAIPLITMDGPLPIGDLFAAGILIVSACLSMNYAAPLAEDLAEMLSEVDFDNYLSNRDENTCPTGSFRRVVRFPGGLKYTDQYCMDIVEAYVYVYLIQGDVYTANEDDALLLAAMHGSAIMERDKAAPSKDISTYFYHYHLGTGRESKAHIFFGLNDAGQGPV